MNVNDVELEILDQVSDDITGLWELFGAERGLRPTLNPLEIKERLIAATDHLLELRWVSLHHVDDRLEPLDEIPPKEASKAIRANNAWSMPNDGGAPIGMNLLPEGENWYRDTGAFLHAKREEERPRGGEASDSS